MSSRRNINIMYAIALLQGMVFYGPIATLYRQNVGVTVFQIAVIEGLSLALSVCLELPWGVAADRIGYRRSMILCCGLYFASKLVFWRAEGFGMFLLERLMLSVVVAGLSGLEESILYCSCDTKQAQAVFGVYQALGTAGLLLASGAYSLLIGENYRLAGLLTALSYGLAAILSLGLAEVKPAGAGRGDAAGAFERALRGLLGNRRLLLLTLAGR